MRNTAIIPARALRIVFVTNYYDYPLMGLCILNGHLSSFMAISRKRYRVIRLSLSDKVDHLISKWLFEVMVGRHWTCTNGKRGEHFEKRTHWNSFLANAYYAIKNGSPFRRAFKPA